MTTQSITAKAIEKAILAGLSTYEREPASGCGRVYVCFGQYGNFDERDPAIKQKNRRLTKALRLATVAAAQKLNMAYQTKGYQVKNALYVGYDNCTGKQLGQGSAITNNLKALGIRAYRSEVGD